jgi:large repetitive protein
MDTLVCANKPFVLYVDGRDYTSVLWYNNSLDLSDTIYSENLYWVDIINECGSIRDEVQITTENCDCEITVPTAFTPNEDMLNDQFYFKSSIDCSTTYYRLEIYDRWGTLMFISIDVNEGWNGYYNGKRCPIGVYTSKYNVKFKHDTQRRTIIKDLTIIE